MTLFILYFLFGLPHIGLLPAKQAGQKSYSLKKATIF